MIERKGLFVYFENVEVLDKLDKSIVNIFYVSEKEKYALIYFDSNRYRGVTEFLKRQEGITSFEDALTDVENYKFNA